MNKNGKDILWTHILQLYKSEQSNLMLYRTKLTDAHVRLNPYSKVVLASLGKS